MVVYSFSIIEKNLKKKDLFLAKAYVNEMQQHMEEKTTSWDAARN